MTTPPSLPRRLAVEAMGTAYLLMAVIGSGIMGVRLSQGNDAIALLANSLATGCALAVLILVFAPISGAHFNPAVTMCVWLQKKIRAGEALCYTAAQIVGALIGTAFAHSMFALPLISLSDKMRSGAAQCWSEGIATFGLMMVIFACARQRSTATPYAIAAYITAAYWFTASTSFANPAVTIARAFSDSFAGIRLADVPPFIAVQIAGALIACAFCAWLMPESKHTA